MARSSYIYTVLVSSRPIAAFTVKHECRSWMHRKWNGKCPVNVEVLRMRDNSDEPPVTVTLAMFDFPQLKRDT